MSEEGGPARKQQRTDYLAWGDYFMATAVLAEKRSKDPRRQVGACIVNEERKIVAVGYNGCPAGWDDDEFPWGYEEKLLYVCHAEMNAILNKNSSDVKNCTMYVTLFPCNECAKIIVQSGIKKVWYMEKTKKHDFKREMIASERMLRKANVEVSQFVAETKTNIMINL